MLIFPSFAKHDKTQMQKSNKNHCNVAGITMNISSDIEPLPLHSVNHFSREVSCHDLATVSSGREFKMSGKNHSWSRPETYKDWLTSTRYVSAAIWFVISAVAFRWNVTVIKTCRGYRPQVHFKQLECPGLLPLVTTTIWLWGRVACSPKSVSTNSLPSRNYETSVIRHCLVAYYGTWWESTASQW